MKPTTHESSALPAFKIVLTIAVVLAAAAMAWGAFEQHRIREQLEASPPRQDLVLERGSIVQPGDKSGLGYPPINWTVERFKKHCAAIEADLAARGVPRSESLVERRKYGIECFGHERMTADGRH